MMPSGVMMNKVLGNRLSVKPRRAEKSSRRNVGPMMKPRMISAPVSSTPLATWMKRSGQSYSVTLMATTMAPRAIATQIRLRKSSPATMNGEDGVVVMGLQLHADVAGLGVKLKTVLAAFAADA